MAGASLRVGLFDARQSVVKLMASDIIFYFSRSRWFEAGGEKKPSPFFVPGGWWVGWRGCDRPPCFLCVLVAGFHASSGGLFVQSVVRLFPCIVSCGTCWPALSWSLSRSLCVSLFFPHAFSSAATFYLKGDVPLTADRSPPTVERIERQMHSQWQGRFVLDYSVVFVLYFYFCVLSAYEVSFGESPIPSRPIRTAPCLAQ